MNIYSIGDYYAKVDGAVVDLKPLLKEETKSNFRRINRFIQLALIGANRCIGPLAVPANMAVYFTSGQGDLDITTDVMERLYLQVEPPKPLSFINTVSNAACFAVSKYLGLEGKSNFITSHCFAFERVLEAAYIDCAESATHTALVGSVDICVAPLSQHRQRIRVAPDCPVAEGSHWWLLARQWPGETPIAEVKAVKNFSNEEQLLLWLSTLQTNEHWFIAAGQYLAEEKVVFIKQQTDINQRFEYCSTLAFYSTQSAAAFSLFIQAEHRGTLLHINADSDGRYSVFIVQTAV